MLIIRDLSYTHPNKDVLFEQVTLTVNRLNKLALVGKNGVGKSTLLRIIAGELQHTNGQCKTDTRPYYIPQIAGRHNHLTISQALKVDAKLKALHSILDGNLSEENYTILDDDWTIEERCTESLHYWGLDDFDVSQRLEELSGGQKTKIFLAGISIHNPALVLLDEPSNHLDLAGRQLLYNLIQSTQTTMMIASHDRKLLNLLDTVCELNRDGITMYGGNYDFYAEQKQLKIDALNQDLQSRQRSLKDAQKKHRETRERKQKLDARGKKKQVNSGMPRSMMHKMRNDAENSAAKLNGAHATKIAAITKEVHDLRASLPDIDKIKVGIGHSNLHKGKILAHASHINFSYTSHPVWPEPLTFDIVSGERIALKGGNGSGKTTLIKLILGSLQPTEGILTTADSKSVYIDQDYSLIDDSRTIYEQAQRVNSSAAKEHEIKIKLDRFLFGKDTWDKPCTALSGGERMRLMLCCLTIYQHAPDLIVLDEPTNNLDIPNIKILTKAINAYKGTLIVVSHDAYFLEDVNIQRTLVLGG